MTAGFRNWNALSLRGKLLALVVTVALVPLSVLTLYGVISGRQTLQEQAVREEGRRVSTAAERLVGALDGLEKKVLFLSRLSALVRLVGSRGLSGSGTPDFWRAQVEETFAALATSYGLFDQVRYLDEKGMEVVRVNWSAGGAVRVPPPELQDKSAHDYFRESLTLESGQVYLSPLDLNREHGQIEIPHKPVIRYAMPVHDAEGRRRGIVILNVLASSFLAPLASFQPGLGGQVFLINRQGDYLYHPDPGKGWGGPGDLGTGEGFTRDHPDLAGAVLANAQGGRPFQRVMETWLVTAQRVGPPAGGTGPWFLVSLVPLAAVFAHVASFQQAFLAVTGLTLVAIVLLGVTFSRSLLGPIARLREGAARIGGGDPAHRIPVERGDELGVLAEGFNRMAADLQAARQTLEEKMDALRKTQQELDIILARMGDGAAVVNEEHRVVYANPRYRALFGEECLGERCYALLGKAGPCEPCLLENPPPEGFATFEASGPGRDLLVTCAVMREEAAPLAVVEMVKDVTEIKRLQQEVFQAEKLSTLGQLVAGVAHEINNPLTYVLGYAQLVKAKEGHTQEIRQDLDRIADGAERIARIVKNLLTFARAAKSEKTLVGINGVLESVLDLMAHSLRLDRIEVRRELAPNDALPKTLADYHQLQQVFLNLVNNAQVAMAALQRPGVLTVKTEHREGTIRVSVSDTGPGISPDNLPRIFDPFFTTKSVGAGTGLGLSVSYGIVQEHGGRIWAESRPGKGTTFFVELSVVTEAQETGPKSESGGSDAPLAPTEARRILVADDEAFILNLCFRIIRQMGHAPDLAHSGQEAIRKLEASRGASYDLILLDLRMPDIGGRKIYADLLARNPRLAERVVFFTGDTVSKDTAAFLAEAGRPFLQKPFTMEEFQEAVRKAMERENL